MACEAKSDEVFSRVTTALRAVLYVVELEAVFASSSAQLALVIVAIKYYLTRNGGYLSRIFLGEVRA